MSRCVQCNSSNTELFRGKDEHFRKECLNCSHIGGPYIAPRSLKEEEEETQEGGIFNY